MLCLLSMPCTLCMPLKFLSLHTRRLNLLTGAVLLQQHDNSSRRQSQKSNEKSMFREQHQCNAPDSEHNQKLHTPVDNTRGWITTIHSLLLTLRLLCDHCIFLFIVHVNPNLSKHSFRCGSMFPLLKSACCFDTQCPRAGFVAQLQATLQ